MSAWRIAVAELYERGGTLRTSQFMRVGDTAHALMRASDLGFVEKLSGHRGVEVTWGITHRGALFAEGRLDMAVPYVPTRTLGRGHGSTLRPVATWLSALPLRNEIRTLTSCGCPTCRVAA